MRDFGLGRDRPCGGGGGAYTIAGMDAPNGVRHNKRKHRRSSLRATLAYTRGRSAVALCHGRYRMTGIVNCEPDAEPWGHRSVVVLIRV